MRVITPTKNATARFILVFSSLLFLTSIQTSTCNNKFLQSVSIGIRSASLASSSSPINDRYFYQRYSSVHNNRRRVPNQRSSLIPCNQKKYISPIEKSHHPTSSYQQSNSHDDGDGDDLTSSSTRTTTIITSRGGAKHTKKSRNNTIHPQLNFWENMICGAVSRSVAQTATHPANTMKTILQSNRKTGAAANKLTLKQIAKVQNFKMLTRGAGAQFVLSIPHGAVNFAVLEYVRKQMNHIVKKSEWATKKQETNAAFGPAIDFFSSAVATICCSVVSTPQMMIVDNIMAGTYPTLPKAFCGLTAEKGLMGFYAGWWPGLAGKIPSYVSYVCYVSFVDGNDEINLSCFFNPMVHCVHCYSIIYF